MAWRSLAWAVATLAPVACLAADSSKGFSYETVIESARTLARTEYQHQTLPELPEPLKKLNYDDYQSIRFKPGKGPWQTENLSFTFQFFHRGFIYQDPVMVHLVEKGRVRDFTFSSAQFDYGKLKVPALPPDLQFAGLRILYPLNTANKQDEVAAFVGASYFRIIGAHQCYGASARGLAIDTAEPSGEEFPRFSQFWIEKPAAAAKSERLYALLDGPSVAGAYQFDIRPGETTEVAVEATLFFRRPVKKLGIAPITSMFLKGENHTRFVPDFRPEVHDSDGLLLQPQKQEWLWRPLINPEKEHVVSRFPGAPLGFGLMQRDRSFDHYQDLAGRYELRPSLWVEPGQSWGTGAVELVEIPTPAEWNDNIVTYWVPNRPPGKGEQLHWTYRISARSDDPEPPELLRVCATRITPAQKNVPAHFVIDFNGKGAAALSADEPIQARLETNEGTIRNLVTEKNQVTGGWRTFFDLAGAGSTAAEVRAVLQRGPQALSETWVYHFQP